jgi:Thioredoxin
MKSVLVAIAASLQLSAPASIDAARLFERGVTFEQFVAAATAQRDVWLRNASRRDISPDAVDRLKRAGRGLRLLIVAEDWCPDSVHTVPYVVNLATAAGIDVRLVDRAQGASVMARHRTRDGRPVTPTIVLLRGDRDVGAWVERPAPIQELFFSMATNPENAKRFRDRAAWYDDDRGRTTIAEILALAENR